MAEILSGYEPSVGEVLAALSRALDLVEGQPVGHALRTSRIAVRIAETLGLAHSQVESLFFASLLKDSGCSNNSARIHKFFGGDEILAKRDVKLIDWSDPIKAGMFGISHAERGGSLVQKLRKIATLARTPTGVMDSVTLARCTRGADIARHLGFDAEVASAIQSLDEHWDGKGSPSKIRGTHIPILARILGLAQTLEVFVTAFGIDSAFEMLTLRNGKWFDPQIVKAAESFRADALFWEQHSAHLDGETIELPVSQDALARSTTDLDTVCSAFAEIIDAKSTFTGQHSIRVTEYAIAQARHFGFDPDRLATLKRASLLHDIGKLGVPNSILDKPAKLSDMEFASIRMHPRFTFEILSAIQGFGRVTEIAAAHHERLDGKGYWRGLGAEDLDLDMRILSAADVFDALSAQRPYRDALPLQEVLTIMRKEAGAGLDTECIEALAEIYQGQEEMAA